MPKKTPWSPSNDDRRKLTEHLVYEIEMTFFLADRLIGTAGTVTDWMPRNAEVEALALHVRQLIDFFWNERPQTDAKRDAFAADYFKVREWAQMRPDRPAALNDGVRRKVGWGVAHLTYDRAWSTPEQKHWRSIDLASALAPAVLRFAERVEEGKLEPGGVERMRSSAAWFLPRHGPAGSSGWVATTALPACDV